MPEFDDDNKTIFSTGLDSEERAAVKSGEKRGEHEAMKENPERFATARRNATDREAFNGMLERLYGT